MHIYFYVFTGVFIDDIHKHWFADYDKLEDNHTYIQWYVEFMPPHFFQWGLLGTDL